MKTYSLTHLSDDTLLRNALEVHARERSDAAIGLAHIAEIDSRKLYRQAGHPSIHSYCVNELLLSPQAAFKRIQAARAARRFPAIFLALARGRLHLSAIVTLAGSLTDETVDDLLRAAENKTKFELERLLAARKLATDVRGQVALANPDADLSLGIVGSPIPAGELRRAPNGDPELSPGIVEPVLMSLEQLSGGADSSTKTAQLQPLRLMMNEEMRDDLQHARNLLGHQIPSGDVAAVLHRGIKALIRELEKRKFSATDRPRPSKSAATPVSRHVPAEVQRAVWARDGGRCTFVGENRKRCPARRMLEFDHILEIARGGESTASNVRLLCKAHNQLRAEQTYGSGFMEDRRREGRAARDQAAAKRDSEQVMGCMRRLGFTADESRRAAAHACGVSNASLEARIRAALAYLVPPRRPRIESTLALSSS